jgi:membrane-bound metal-dependent hydrolase YbcI (DUF457 family)
MYFFFHLLTGIILGFLLSDFLEDQRWLIPCAAGAILPDLIDKPIGYLLFPTTIGYGRIYTHTLLVAIMILVLGMAIWKLKKDPGVIAVGIGILSHQILDMMWLQPVNWYYPLLGPFRGTMSKDYFFTLIFRELYNPFEIFLGIFLGIGVLAFIYRNNITTSISRNCRLISMIAAAGALLLCIISGMIIGCGITHHPIPELGWSRPEDLIIGGIVIALSALLVWRWRDVLSRM